MHYLNLFVLFTFIPFFLAQTLPCTFSDSSGMIYDFSALQNSSFEYTQSGLYFYVTPCAFTPKSISRCIRAAPAIYWDDTFCWYCGELSTQKFSKNKDGTIDLTYSSGELGGGCHSRQINFNFECDPKEGGIYKAEITTTEKCEYTLYWKTKYACDSKLL